MENIANKLKSIEQAAAAIKRIEGETKDTNFNWNLLFPPKKRLHLGWLVLSVVVYLTVCIVAVVIGAEDQQKYLITFVAGLMAITWLSCCAHLRFEKNTITGGVALAMLVGFLVAAGIFTPSQGADNILNRLPDLNAKNN
ncbi:MAG: hypothetical protein HHJ09_14045 [Glaciimonas sp.]|nr:hypothetical protein [Glaciimonas sp.]